MTSDGTSYVEYEVRQIAYPPKITSSILYLMTIGLDGSTTSAQLTSTSLDQNLFPGPIIPDNQGGVVATWAISPSTPPVPAHPYQAAHVVSGAVSAPYDLPFTRSTFPVPYGKYPTLVLGENNTAFATDGTNPDSGPQIASFDLATGNLNWSPYQASPQSTLSLVGVGVGNNLVAKITNSSDTIVRFDTAGSLTYASWISAASSGSSTSNAPSDTSTPAAYTNVQYDASDRWVGVPVGLDPFVEFAGDEILWALSAWGSPRNDGAADPKITIPLTVSHVQNTHPYDITTQVNTAITFWWQKAKIKLSWDSKIVEVPGCDPARFPNGCGAFPQYDITDVTSLTTAGEVVRRFCDPGATLTGSTKQCRQNGSQLLFTEAVGGFQAFGSPGGQTLLDSTATDFWNFSLLSTQAQERVTAHELGHQFSLRHIFWAQLNNLMCTNPACPVLPGDYLAPDQVKQAQQGAAKWNVKQ